MNGKLWLDGASGLAHTIAPGEPRAQVLRGRDCNGASGDAKLASSEVERLIQFCAAANPSDLERHIAMTYHGRVQAGVIVLDDAPTLPDGVEVRVEVLFPPEKASTLGERLMKQAYPPVETRKRRGTTEN